MSRRWSRWHVAAGTTAIALMVVLGGCAEGTGGTGSESSPPATSAPASTVASPAVPGAAEPMAESKPVRLDIPAIDVRSGELIELGLQPDGSLEVPDDALTTGWFDRSPTPGEVGPAVIAAHVDYDNVPGIFHRLHELRVGAKAVVHRADGTSAEFTVEKVERYAKAEFPTQEVYGNTDAPELRLITCGGEFDSSTGNYRDNVIAYAKLTRADRN